MNCSICGHSVAWCVDKDDKGTYWLCGECATHFLMESFLEKQILVRVARAADGYFEITTGHWSNFSKNMEEYENLRLAVAGRLSKAIQEAEANHLL